MAFKSFVEDTRRTNLLIQQKLEEKKNSGSQGQIIDTTQGNQVSSETIDRANQQESRIETQIEKPTNSLQENSTVVEEIPRRQETIIHRGNQKIDNRHGNIIADVIRGSNDTFCGNATWENCKYKKTVDGNTYCTEFHSICGKERCKRATR